jgi:Cdc6-like AAA superfamily ATPase
MTVVGTTPVTIKVVVCRDLPPSHDHASPKERRLVCPEDQIYIFTEVIMNKNAAQFVGLFRNEFYDAFQATAEVYKADKDYESDPLFDIVSTLMSIAFCYAEECGVSLTTKLCEFVYDCQHALMGDEDMVNSLSAGEKEEYYHMMYRHITTSCGADVYSLNQFGQRIAITLHNCNRYDAAMDSSTREGLIAAYTRFAYLLINEDFHITDSENTFYARFKAVLASQSINEEFTLIDDGPGRRRRQRSKQAAHRSRSRLRQLQRSQEPPAISTGLDSPYPGKQAAVSSEPKSLDDLLVEINGLIGLENIKQEVAGLVNLLRVQQMRYEAGLSSLETSNHMVFYGNPGTGKTTIARKIGQIFMQLGILSKGHLIETDRAGLVAGYLGQTAIKTKEVLDNANGGILFIDEAYTLCQDNSQDQYGQEATDTILKYMEDNRRDVVVIVAGYNDEMVRFINSNPGLKSRFNKYFRFPDYSAEELYEIFKDMATKAQYTLDAECQEKLKRHLFELHSNKGENFGNGRTVRNLFERCVANQANRIISLANLNPHELMRLTAGDIQHELVSHLES